ncbi:MAG: polymerase epsilon subunit [Chitinophagaceae bacterium]|nr:polymerase epsilon subunit [Chitinophagaceae bacterium]
MKQQLSIFDLPSPMLLNLHKPLAFFDLETTGINVTSDRILEISIVKVLPGNNEVEIKTERINPMMPIPLESSLIHGIYEKDIADKPTFKDLAHVFNNFLKGCDLAGFNILKFDVPVLQEEFNRADIDFDLHGRRMVDAQKIFHMMEPRTLSAAYKFYCNKDLNNAHSAEADTLATYEVLKAQVTKYDNLSIKDKKGNDYIPVKNDIQSLHELSAGNLVDLAGRMAFNDQAQVVFNFGKYKGVLVSDVFKKDPSYYDWMMKGDFPIDTKKKLTAIKLEQLKNK